MKQLFADRLRSARILNGFSLQDLANSLQTQISKQSLHKYEKGDVVPDSDMIALLAQALGVRPEFFFRDLRVELGPIEFRKLKKLGSKEEHRIIAKVKDHLERYLELEELLAMSSQFENEFSNWALMSSFEQVEKAAQQIREKWKLGCDPIANCVELLEDNHIKVIEIDSAESFYGLQTWVNETIPVIVINSTKVHSSDRKRFTVLHELAHLVLPFEKDLPEKHKEKLCHQFAASMLLPEVAAIKELGKGRSKLMIQELGALKKQYGISIQAIIMRARDLSIITESYTKQFFFYFSQMGWKSEEPVQYIGEEKSLRFRQLLFRALAEENITMAKAAELSNQSLAAFRENLTIVA